MVMVSGGRQQRRVEMAGGGGRQQVVTMDGNVSVEHCARVATVSFFT